MANPTHHADHAPRSEKVTALLVDNHRDLLAFLERRVGDRAVAEDILQETLVKGLARGDSIRNDESMRAWIYRSLRNAVIDHFRRQASAARAKEGLAAEATEADEDLDRAVCQCINRLAETLKPEYADVLRRVEVEGLAVKAYAEASGDRTAVVTEAGAYYRQLRVALRHAD